MNLFNLKRNVSVNINLLDFVTKLDLEIGECIISHLIYRPEIVKFTYNFYSLMSQWRYLINSWNGINCNYELIGCELLFKFISENLDSAKLLAVNSCIFVKLESHENIVVNPNACNSDPTGMSCERYLIMASSLVKSLCAIVVHNIGRIKKDSPFLASREQDLIMQITTYRKMDLLIQRCLTNIETIKKEQLSLSSVSALDVTTEDFFEKLENQINNIVEENLQCEVDIIRFAYNFSLGVTSEDFFGKLESQINNSVKENLQYEVDIIRFAYNFSLLVEEYFQLESCGNKVGVFCCPGDSWDLVGAIYKSLCDVRMCSVKCGFMELNRKKELVVNHRKMYRNAILPCRCYLVKMNILIKKLCNVMTGGDIEINNMLKKAKRMGLLVQNCLKDLEVIGKKEIVKNAMYKLQLVSCLNIIGVRRQQEQHNMSDLTSSKPMFDLIVPDSIISDFTVFSYLNDIKTCKQKQERKLDISASGSRGVKFIEEKPVTDLSSVDVSTIHAVAKR
ncbi:hypothetical protein K6025_04965 [Ehrlichia sp. JZT12]